MVGGPCYKQPHMREHWSFLSALKNSWSICAKFCGREGNNKTKSFAFTSQHASSALHPPLLWEEPNCWPN